MSCSQEGVGTRHELFTKWSGYQAFVVHKREGVVTRHELFARVSGYQA